MAKHSASKRFFDKLRKKFQLSIFNESTLESIFTLRVSRLDGLFMLVSVGMLFVFLSYLLIRFTPVGQYLPMPVDHGLHNQLLSDAYRVDSLHEELQRQIRYIDVVKRIVAGELPADSTEYDREIPMDTLANHHLDLMHASQREQDFRAKYEETERYNLSSLKSDEQNLVQLLYLPVKGTPVGAFNPAKDSYGIELEVESHQAVLSVLDGTVVYAGFSPDLQYVLHIQHSNDFLSVYKNAVELLCKQGDVVKAGAPIAMVGRSREIHSRLFLIFELWQRGKALNPLEYLIIE